MSWNLFLPRYIPAPAFFGEALLFLAEPVPAAVDLTSGRWEGRLTV